MEIFFLGIPFAIAFLGGFVFTGRCLKWRKDSERLDWLEMQRGRSSPVNRVRLILSGEFDVFASRYNTVREAIDAARLKENR